MASASPLLRSPQGQVALLLHLLLFLIVVATVLTFLPLNDEFLNPSGWYPTEYYKLKANIDKIPTLRRTLKDGFALLLLVGSLWFKPTHPNPQLQHNGDLKLLYGLGLALLGLALLRTLATPLGLTNALATLRPLVMSVALFVFCHRHLNPAYLRWVLEALNPLALLQLYYAYQQRINSVDWHGVTFWSRGAVRSVGTFAEPNTLGLFLALVVYLNLSVLPPHPLRYGLVAACAMVALYFADSRSAALLIAMLIILELYRRLSHLDPFLRRPAVLGLVIAPLGLGMTYWLLGEISSSSVRGDMGDNSGGRLGAVLGAVNSSGPIALLVGKHLGSGSNVLQMLNQASRSSGMDLIISDSTLAALINQVGLLGVVVFGGIIYVLLKLPIHSSALPGVDSRRPPALRQERAGLVAILLLVGLSNVIFEMYALWPIIVPLMFPWHWLGQQPFEQAR